MAASLRRFCRAHKGERVTVEVLDERLLHAVLVAGVPLRDVRVDGAELTIEVRRAHGGAALDVITLPNPDELALERSHEGIDRGLDIVVHDGRRYRLRLDTAPPP